MAQEKLKQLQDLIKLVHNSLTKEDFVKAFNSVLQVVRGIEQKNEQALNQLVTRAKTLSEKVSYDAESTLEEVKQQCAMFLGEQADAIKQKLAQVKNGKDGRDGENPDPMDVVPLVLAALPDEKEETGNEIIEKINNADSLIVKQAVEGIEELEKKLEDLKRQVTEAKPLLGIGVSDMRIRQAFKLILHTEQPTGAINGSNTVYTVTKPIFAVLSFSLNGETIAQLPNYTISGKTITFSTALPADYSGKDFEIKYI